MAFSESSLSYDIKHKGDKAKGICGIVPEYWNWLLQPKGIHYNDIKACIEVYNYLVTKYQSPEIALKKYKGVDKEMWVVDKVIKVYKEVK